MTDTVTSTQPIGQPTTLDQILTTNPAAVSRDQAVVLVMGTNPALLSAMTGDSAEASGARRNFMRLMSRIATIDHPETLTAPQLAAENERLNTLMARTLSNADGTPRPDLIRFVLGSCDCGIDVMNVIQRVTDPRIIGGALPQALTPQGWSTAFDMNRNGGVELQELQGGLVRAAQVALDRGINLSEVGVSDFTDANANTLRRQILGEVGATCHNPPRSR